METSAPDALEEQLNELERRIARLEAEISELRRGRAVSETRTAYAPVAQRTEPAEAVKTPPVELPERAAREKAPTLPPNVPPASAEMEPILARLYAEGVLVPPPPEMLEIAAEWDKVPEEEKRALDVELRNLKLDPPLSEMIHLMRGGWYPEISEQAGTEGE